MTNQAACRECHAPLSSDAVEGLCRQCQRNLQFLTFSLMPSKGQENLEFNERLRMRAKRSSLMRSILLFATAALCLTGCTYNVSHVDSIVPALGENGINGAVADESHAYYCKETSLYVLDISGKGRKPVLVSSLVLPEKATARAISGKLVFLLGWYGSGLMIVDVSDVAAPRMLGRYAPVGYDSVEDAIAVAGTSVYVGANGTVSVIDISVPSAPLLLNSVKVSAPLSDMAATGTRLLGACGFQGLYIVDASNPKEPVVAGTYQNGTHVRAVAVRDSTAYVASGWGPGSGRFQIVDFSEPARPALLSTLNTSWLAGDVAIAGSLAYVTDGKSGVRIVDISNPRSPRICGSYRTWDTSSLKVAASGSFAFVINAPWSRRVSQLDILEFRAYDRMVRLMVVFPLVILMLSVTVLLVRKRMRKSLPQDPVEHRTDLPSTSHIASMDSPAAANAPGAVGGEVSAHTESLRGLKRLLSILRGTGETLLVETITMIAYAVIAVLLGKRGIILSPLWICLFLVTVAGLSVVQCVRNGKRRRGPRAIGNILALLLAIPAALYILLVLAFAIEGVP